MPAEHREKSRTCFSGRKGKKIRGIQQYFDEHMIKEEKLIANSCCGWSLYSLQMWRKYVPPLLKIKRLDEDQCKLLKRISHFEQLTVINK